MKKHIEIHAATGGDFASMHAHGNEGISKCAGCGSSLPNDDLYDAAQDISCQIEHFEPCSQLFEHPEGYFLPLDLTSSLHTLIELRISEMASEVPYSLKEICGKRYWKSLSKLERRLAPTCVNFLKDYEGLPIKLEDFDEKNNALYCLK